MLSLCSENSWQYIHFLLTLVNVVAERCKLFVRYIQCLERHYNLWMLKCWCLAQKFIIKQCVLGNGVYLRSRALILCFRRQTNYHIKKKIVRPIILPPNVYLLNWIIIYFDFYTERISIVQFLSLSFALCLSCISPCSSSLASSSVFFSINVIQYMK